jgi:hypothetical protein
MNISDAGNLVENRVLRQEKPGGRSWDYFNDKKEGCFFLPSFFFAMSSERKSDLLTAARE